jgi:hypothetical protein
MNKQRVNILFGDLVLFDGKKRITLDDCVFKEDATHYKNKEIKEVLFAKIVGQTAIHKGYTQAKKSDEVRNEITGAYE